MSRFVSSTMNAWKISQSATCRVDVGGQNTIALQRTQMLYLEISTSKTRIPEEKHFFSNYVDWLHPTFRKLILEHLALPIILLITYLPKLFPNLFHSAGDHVVSCKMMRMMRWWWWWWCWWWYYLQHCIQFVQRCMHRWNRFLSPECWNDEKDRWALWICGSNVESMSMSMWSQCVPDSSGECTLGVHSEHPRPNVRFQANIWIV